MDLTFNTLPAAGLPPAVAVLNEQPTPLRPKRKLIYLPGEAVPADAFTRVLHNGTTEILYQPSSEKHKRYHASTLPKLILEGRRGTGKSHTERWDFHLRSMAYPGYRYLMLRRTTGELRKSHLTFLGTDMDKLGGRALGLRSGNTEAIYANGSLGLFGFCETESDIDKYLSAEFHAICFDEITTFEWDMITRISSSCRVPEGSGLTAIVRGGTNPLGVSAEDVYRYFIARDLTREEDPKYRAHEWGSLHIEREDCGYVDYEQYDRTLSGLSQAYREAWLDGKWGVDGAYFSIESRHCIPAMPVIPGSDGLPAASALRWPWLHIYRVLDYGWHDPTVCVWVAVLPNGRYVPFKEMSWVRTTAQQVALDVKAASDGMKIITTIADPTLWDGLKEMGHCLADEIENLGVPLTKGKNDRTAAGLAIQECLNTLLPDGSPKLQIVDGTGGVGEPGCPTLVRTLKAMKVDKKNPGRIADHKADHMPIALGYFCMAGVGPTRIPNETATRPWMKQTVGIRKVLGSAQVRGRRYHTTH